MTETESRKDRVNRELKEFLEELRVTLPGVEILFAFLLTIAFTERFAKLGDAEKRVYFVAVACMALASVLLIAPAVHHRMRFRTADKEQILKAGTRNAVAATILLAIGFPAALWLVARVVFGAGVAALTAGMLAGITVVLWFVVPLFYRRPPG